MPTCRHCIARIEYCKAWIADSSSAVHPASSMADLQESLRAQCPICSTLWRRAYQSIHQTNFPPMSDEHTFDDLKSADESNDLIKFRIEDKYDNTHFPRVHVTLRLKPSVQGNTVIEKDYELVPEPSIRRPPHDVDATREHSQGGRDVAGYTGDPAILSVIAEWIKDCHKNHTCRFEDDQTFMPRRLVDVSVPNHEHHFRILTNATPAPYLTLSHRWGDSKFLKLQKHNLRMLSEGLSDIELPKTFQDAITVCRILEVRYIWIDSLCIIQDDPVDWAEQSQQMGTIYSRGLCNLAGDDNDASTGLFHHRNSNLLDHIHLEITSSTEPSIGEGRYQLVEGSEDGGVRLFMASLSQRGWVFQERMLSPRIVHFLDDRLVWECSVRIAQESHPLGIEVDGKENFESDLKSLTPFTRSNVTSAGESGTPRPSDCESPCDFCEHWRWIVQGFTDKELTYPDDRPMAIAGLAAKIQSLSGEEYVLGMWKNHLRCQLMWQEYESPYFNDFRSITGLHEQSKRRYPSWSWLSVDVAVNLPQDERVHSRKYAFEILELIIHDPRTSEDPRDRVLHQTGTLKIAGHLKAINLENICPNPRLPAQTSCDVSRTHPDHETTTFIGDFIPHNWKDNELTHEHFMMHLAIDTTCPWSATNAGIRLMGMCWHTVHRWLVLRVCSREDATFERIGLLSYVGDKEILEESIEEDEGAPGEREEEEGRRVFYLV